MILYIPNAVELNAAETGRCSASLNASDGIIDRRGDVEIITLYLPKFCKKMADAAREWYEEKKNDPVVAANRPHLVQLRANAHLFGTTSP